MCFCFVCVCSCFFLFVVYCHLCFAFCFSSFANCSLLCSCCQLPVAVCLPFVFAVLVFVFAFSLSFPCFSRIVCALLLLSLSLSFSFASSFFACCSHFHCPSFLCTFFLFSIVFRFLLSAFVTCLGSPYCLVVSDVLSKMVQMSMVEGEQINCQIQSHNSIRVRKTIIPRARKKRETPFVSPHREQPCCQQPSNDAFRAHARREKEGERALVFFSSPLLSSPHLFSPQSFLVSCLLPLAH